MRIPTLRPPRLRTAAQESHRAATWLELFYDLAFVVAVGQLASGLLDHHDGPGVFRFVGLFIPLWWSWASYTFYADRYDTDDLGQRLLAVIQMVAIAVMAASVSFDEANSLTAFAASFTLARGLLLIMYGRAYLNVPRTQVLVAGYLKGFSLGGLLWLISIWIPSPAQQWVWAVALLIDFSTPYIMRKVQATVPLDNSHLPERFGLFTILVFGESIVAVVAGLAHHVWDLETTIQGAIAVMVASAMWWLYFDNAEGAVVRRDATVTRTWRPTGWIYAHLPLAISLTAMGIGLEFFVAGEVAGFSRWILGVATAVALAMMAVIAVASASDAAHPGYRRARVRLAGAALALIVAAVSGGWHAIAILAAFLVIGAVQIVLDLLMTREERPHYQEPPEPPHPPSKPGTEIPDDKAMPNG